MLFNSFTFALFFVLVVLVNSLPLPWRLRKLNLLIASYLFYAAWNPPFVILLWVSTLIDWLAAKGLGRTQNPFTRRLLLLLSLSTNLGLLGFFKYADMLLQSFVEIAGLMGVDYQPATSMSAVVLPLGISFYTFQTLSYSIDVYRGRMAPWPSLLDFSLFVAFFPQLIAGPIVRAGQFLPQCVEPKRPTSDRFGWGLSLIVLGMFMKIVLADSFFAPVVNVVYAPGLRPSMGDAWIATFSFVGQLYCDFAGYSTCAVGLALCLGFEIPANFRFPLAMSGIADFWRRWHISLSTWLHDYIFQPLGGYWRSRSRAAFNLMVTMILCGLWHGSTLTFLIFGTLHGLYMVGEMLLRRTWLHRHRFWRTFFGQGVLWAICFTLLAFSTVFFRSQNLEQARSVVEGLVGLASTNSVSHLDDIDILFATIPLQAIIVMHFLLRDGTLEDAVGSCPWWLWSVACALMLAAIVLIPGKPDEFIYFQF